MHFSRHVRVTVVTLIVAVTTAAGIAFASGNSESSGAQASGSGPAKISVWVQGDAVRYPGFVAVTQAFEKENPNITVELTNVPGSWTDEYQKLLTGYVGGVWPDVVYAKGYSLPTFAAKGMLLDLTKYWVSAKNGVLNAGNKFDQIVQEQGSFKGRVYGLPRGQYWFALGYNVDMFKKAGIDHPPTTWEEFQQDGMKLTSTTNGTWGFQPYTYYRSDSTYVQTMLEMWTEQAGGHIMTYDSNAKPVYHLAGNQQAKEALQFELDNMYKYKDWLDPSLESQDSSAGLNMVYNNKIAMWWMHGGTISRFKAAAPNLNYLTAPLPGKVTQRSYIDSQQWMINGKTKYPDQSWKYIEYFTSQPAEATFAPYEGHLSVWPENWKLPVYTDSPGYKGIEEQYQLPDTVPYVYHDSWLSVRAAIAREIQKILFQKVSIDQGLQNAQKAADDEMQKQGL